MKKPSFAIFAAITLVLLIAALYISQQRAPQTSHASPLLLPDLGDAINTIDQLRIASAEAQIDIKKQDGTWVIEQADNYPAQFDKVKQTVVAVADLRLLAEKTSNPALYNRLGVEDITDAGARSHRLTFAAAGTPVASLIIGDARHSKSPADRPGLYVRHPDSKQALLVLGSVAVSAKPADWFDKNVLDINSREVKSIRIAPAGKPPIELTRSDANADLMLANIPAGRGAQADVMISQMGTLLEGVFAEAVRRESNLQQASEVASFTVNTFNGLAVHGQVVQQEEQFYTLFSVTAAPVAETAEQTDTDELSIIEQAEQLQQAVAGWGYVLPQHKTDLFTKTLDDLTHDKDEAEE